MKSFYRFTWQGEDVWIDLGSIVEVQSLAPVLHHDMLYPPIGDPVELLPRRASIRTTGLPTMVDQTSDEVMGILEICFDATLHNPRKE